MDRQEFINSIKDIKIKGVKGTIDILMRDKTTEKREAVIYGNYAVLKIDNQRYGVTYIPTGESVCATIRLLDATLIAKAYNQYFPRSRKNPSKTKVKEMSQLIRVIMHNFSPVPKFVKEDHVN